MLFVSFLFHEKCFSRYFRGGFNYILVFRDVGIVRKREFLEAVFGLNKKFRFDIRFSVYQFPIDLFGWPYFWLFGFP